FANVRPIGSGWTRAAFDGAFYETPPDGGGSLGVVFVRSRGGDTATRNPAALGGGTVDQHLIYEGLSRVAADAVVAGAGTLHADGGHQGMARRARPGLLRTRSTVRWRRRNPHTNICG